MMNNEKIIDRETIVGQKPTDQDIKDLDKANIILSDEKRLTRLEEFGKWLFSITSVIGILVTAFSTSLSNGMNGVEEISFTICLTLITISLILSTLALTPQSMKYNPRSLTSIRNLIENVLIRRRAIFLRTAGIAMALSILFGGLSTLIPKITKSEKASSFEISYYFTFDKAIIIEIKADFLSKHKPVDLKISLNRKGKKEQVFISHTYPNKKGEFLTTVNLPKCLKLTSSDTIVIHSNWYNNRTLLKDSLYQIYIPKKL